LLHRAEDVFLLSVEHVGDLGEGAGFDFVGGGLRVRELVGGEGEGVDAEGWREVDLLGCAGSEVPAEESECQLCVKAGGLLVKRRHAMKSESDNEIRDNDSSDACSRRKKLHSRKVHYLVSRSGVITQSNEHI